MPPRQLQLLVSTLIKRGDNDGSQVDVPADNSSSAADILSILGIMAGFIGVWVLWRLLINYCSCCQPSWPFPISSVPARRLSPQAPAQSASQVSPNNDIELQEGPGRPRDSSSGRANPVPTITIGEEPPSTDITEDDRRARMTDQPTRSETPPGRPTEAPPPLQLGPLFLDRPSHRTAADKMGNTPAAFERQKGLEPRTIDSEITEGSMKAFARRKDVAGAQNQDKPTSKERSASDETLDRIEADWVEVEREAAVEKEKGAARKNFSLPFRGGAVDKTDKKDVGFL